MSARTWVASLSFTIMVVGLGVFASLFFVTAPYGRHARSGWGPGMRTSLGWLVMESPASLAFLAFYLGGQDRARVTPLVFLALWQLHYVHRAFFFPWSLREVERTMPLAVVGMGGLFNLLNAYVNARYISSLGDYTVAWLESPRLVLGLVLFLAGLAANWHSDRVLLTLRGSGKGYLVPEGGLFRFVSCPNYLGEIVEWAGWAVATSSLPGLAFAFFTAANLVPRARAHHRWFKERFADYPPNRRALIPFVW